MKKTPKKMQNNCTTNEELTKAKIWRNNNKRKFRYVITETKRRYNKNKFKKLCMLDISNQIMWDKGIHEKDFCPYIELAHVVHEEYPQFNFIELEPGYKPDTRKDLMQVLCEIRERRNNG